MPRILSVPVGGSPLELTIPRGLEAMQKLVGGYIEMVTLEEGIDLVCNEEGKLQGLPANRDIPELRDTIRGDFFISRHDEEGETVDLTDADVKKYTKRFL